jgi:AcrR family transcriptional regulator
MPARRRSQEDRVAESNERLLTAAIELIALQGFDRTTVAEIGTRAGYSHGIVHARFGSKEALLESILRAYEGAMLPSAPPDEDGLGQVIHQLESAARRGMQEPQFFRAFSVLFFETIGPAESLRNWVAEWLDRYLSQITERLEVGKTDGSVRKDIDPAAEAQWLLENGIGKLFRWLASGAEQPIDQQLNLLRDELIKRVS